MINSLDYQTHPLKEIYVKLVEEVILFYIKSKIFQKLMLFIVLIKTLN